MNRRSRTREVIDLIDFKENWLDHIVTRQLKPMIVEQVRNVLPPSRKEIVETEHILSIRQQAFAQMRTNESGAASDKYSQDIWENASERYNDSVAANIGKQVCAVNNVWETT